MERVLEPVEDVEHTEQLFVNMDYIYAEDVSEKSRKT